MIEHREAKCGALYWLVGFAALLSKLRSAGSDSLTIEHQKLLDAIERRLSSSTEWIVSLKTQIVMHRALQDRATLLFARAVTARTASLLEPMKTFLDKSKSDQGREGGCIGRSAVFFS